MMAAAQEPATWALAVTEHTPGGPGHGELISRSAAGMPLKGEFRLQHRM